MKKLILLCTLALLTLIGKAQNVSYQLADIVSESNGEVTFNLHVFCNSKNELNKSACLAGIRCIMFNGIPKTKFAKPLLNEGEKSLIENHPGYFSNLYNDRFDDYVKECIMLSKYKKSGVGKGTLFQVTVRVFDLRKDLEKNNIKKTFGI